MVENCRYYIDVLDQLSAVTALIEAIAELAGALHRSFTSAVAVASRRPSILGDGYHQVSEFKELRMMRVNRKTVTIGLLGLGMIGAVAVGGVAAAAPGVQPQVPADAVASCSGGGHFGTGYGMAGGMNAPIIAAATYLDLSQADLQTQLGSGNSLADVAKAQGKAVSGLEDAMVAAVKINLDNDTRLTAAEKTARLALVKSAVTTMVNTVRTPGDGDGPMGAGMDGNQMVGGMGMGTDGAEMGGGRGMHGGN